MVDRVDGWQAVAAHGEEPHPCCDRTAKTSGSDLMLGCPGMDASSSPLGDVAAAAADPWDLPQPVLHSCHPSLAVAPPLPAGGQAAPFASTPETHPSLRFRVLRI